MSKHTDPDSALDLAAGSVDDLVRKLEAQGYRVVIVDDVRPKPQPPPLNAFILTAPKKYPEPPLGQPKEWWRGGRPR